MKKLYLILAALLLVASCKKKDDVQVPVRIHVNDFTITQDTLPSKDGIPEYNGVKAVTLAFYNHLWRFQSLPAHGQLHHGGLRLWSE